MTADAGENSEEALTKKNSEGFRNEGKEGRDKMFKLSTMKVPFRHSLCLFISIKFRLFLPCDECLI